MRAVVSAIALASASLLLGGCQSIFGDAFAAGSSRANSASVDLSDYFALRLETGRRHLAHNRPTQAIVAFRQASYDAAHSGEAFNGMAVAYAQIGRRDLAERYFKLAIAADPTDVRYVRNLAKLDRAPEPSSPDVRLAETDETPRLTEALASAVAVAAAETPQSAPARVSVEGSASSLVRVGAREVQLVSRDVAGSRTRDHALRSRQTYPIRIALPASRPAERPANAVQLALNEANSTRRRTYPIRIELPKTR